MEEKKLKRFEELLAEGKDILSKYPAYARGESGKGTPSDLEYARFLSQSMNLIELALSTDSSHFKQIERLATGEKSANNSYYFRQCYGILEAAYKDYRDNIIQTKCPPAESTIGFLQKGRKRPRQKGI